jgi:Tfp pilus assembly protein PilO
MKNVNVIGLVLISLSALVFSGNCAKGKYNDMAVAMEKQKNLQNEFINKMDKADNAKDVASALSAYSKSMADLEPVFAELEKKYPELQELPEELKDLDKALADQGEIISTRISDKILKFSEDPAVSAEFGKLMNPQQSSGFPESTEQ